VSVRGEASESFACFGSTCSVHVRGDAFAAAVAVAAARRDLLEWHDRFTRFETDSELSRVNADPRAEVAVTPMMARFAEAVVLAGRRSGGLVDATLVDEIEAAGYIEGSTPGLSLADALAIAPERRRAAPRRPGGWETIVVDAVARRLTRPPGVRLDSGGIAKGLFADVLAERLEEHDAYAVVCGGDLRVGGGGAAPARAVDVESPFDGRILHTFEIADAGVATSGIGRRAWIGPDGAPAHHVLDPLTGRPAYTGIVQATAIAPTAVEAEIRAKAALLSGPAGAAARLPGGGAIVYDDGSADVLPHRSEMATIAPNLAAR